MSKKTKFFGVWSTMSRLCVSACMDWWGFAKQVADGQEPEDLQSWLYLGALITNPEPKMHFRVLFGTSLICFGNLRISMGNKGFVA